MVAAAVADPHRDQGTQRRAAGGALGLALGQSQGQRGGFIGPRRSNGPVAPQKVRAGCRVWRWRAGAAQPSY